MTKCNHQSCYVQLSYVSALFPVWIAASEADDVRDTGRTSVWRDVYDVAMMGCTWSRMAGWLDGGAAEAVSTGVKHDKTQERAINHVQR
jgi:hypothetical protein